MELTLTSFLLWLASGGGATVVASFILERLAWYQAKSSTEKQWWFFGSASSLSVAAYCFITYMPAEILSAIAPFFALVASIFASVFLGTLFHQYDKQEPKG